MNEIFEWLINVIITGSFLVKVRTFFGLGFLVLLGRKYLSFRKSRKKRTEVEESEEINNIFQKNEKGLYPWEFDQDDHPKRIDKDAKRLSTHWGPERGRW